MIQPCDCSRVCPAARPARAIWQCLLVAVALCAAPGSALAQNPPEQTEPGRVARTAAVQRASSEIVIDGVLSEPAWMAARTIGGLLQREPLPGQPPTEQTEVRLLYDDDNLYVGVVAFDSEPSRVIGTQMARDANLGDDDRIELILDTFLDRRNAFYFATNPAGALVDGLVIENRELNREWDAIWYVRTRHTEDGWTAEFAIPFKSLSFPAGQTTWGFNFSRTIQRKIEEDRWAAARLEMNFRQVSEAGTITDLESLSQGVGLDIRPFIGGTWTHVTADGRNILRGKPGLDAFYNLTPSLKLTTTVNTDFAETEADQRQVNLTRFSLFFPEKRAFFLENAGVFNFSNTGQNNFTNRGAQIIPFFSRRIGLLEGEEVPIDFGIKLTGKIGNTDIGILDVRTRDALVESDTVPGKNFFVGRLKQNILEQSYIGAIFTHGDPANAASARTYGFDVNLATSQFLGSDKNFSFNAFGLTTRNEGVSGDDWAYGFSADYPNDVVVLNFDWRLIQENFRPALGFAPRENVRRTRITAQYRPRPRDFLDLRRMSHTINYTRYVRLDNGELETRQIRIVPFNWNFNSDDTLNFEVTHNYERLFEDFDIAENVILPPGEYGFLRYQAGIQTAAKRRWVAQLDWTFGEFWSGRAHEVEAQFQYKIPPRFIASVRANQTFARLPEGNFVARVLTAQADFSLTPFMSFANLIQFDNESRELGWQSRFRWILRPGNDLFIVFSQGWIQDDDGGFRYRAQESKLATKFQYTFRF